MLTTAIVSFREFLEAFLIVGMFLGISRKLKLKKEIEGLLSAGTGIMLLEELPFTPKAKKALASAAPAKAVPEVLRNSRRVVRFESVRLVEFMELVMFTFTRFELFMAIGRIIPVRPALGKSRLGVSRHRRRRADIPVQCR